MKRFPAQSVGRKWKPRLLTMSFHPNSTNHTSRSPGTRPCVVAAFVITLENCRLGASRGPSSRWYSAEVRPAPVPPKYLPRPSRGCCPSRWATVSLRTSPRARLPLLLAGVQSPKPRGCGLAHRPLDLHLCLRTGQIVLADPFRSGCVQLADRIEPLWLSAHLGPRDLGW